MTKYNCMGPGDGNKKRDKPIDGCAKSQSFYSGMNQLVHVASNGQGNSTMSTSPSSCKPMDANRVRNLTSRDPYYEIQLQPTASSSPAFSSTSTTILCPSNNFQRKLPPYPDPPVWLDPHHQPHNIFLTNQSFLYSSAYEVENPSPVSLSYSTEHIYSQIPSPQPTPNLFRSTFHN
jgi:hypothetical protein